MAVIFPISPYHCPVYEARVTKAGEAHYTRGGGLRETNSQFFLDLGACDRGKESAGLS